MPLDADAALSLAQELATKLVDRRSDIEKRDDYYAGKQPLRFATDEWAKAHAKRYVDFSDNWCGVVADSPAERVHVTGFRLDNDGPMSPEERALWDDWKRNELDAESAQGFLESFVASRSFAIVWGDENDEPVVSWEHPSEVIVAYSTMNRRERVAAVKLWSDDSHDFLTLYTSDEVWKWHRSRTKTNLTLPKSFLDDRASWEPRAEDDEPWPMTHDLGVVPVVEFANRPRLGRDPISDIAGTMAMQDSVNLLWAYLFNAADYASMPARVVMGQAPPVIPVLDANGQKVGEVPVDEKRLTEGRLLWLTGQNTSIGSFPAANLTAFTEIVEVAVGHIAAQTRTPQHYLVGKMANLSGDALKAAETGLVKKCEEAQTFFTAPTREVFRLMALVRGNREVAEQARLGTVVWKDAESRSEAQLVDGLQKLRAVGFPFAWIAERYGLSQTEVDRLLAMKEAEANDPLLSQIADKLTAADPVMTDAAPSGV